MEFKKNFKEDGCKYKVSIGTAGKKITVICPFRENRVEHKEACFVILVVIWQQHVCRIKGHSTISIKILIYIFCLIIKAEKSCRVWKGKNVFPVQRYWMVVKAHGNSRNSTLFCIIVNIVQKVIKVTVAVHHIQKVINGSKLASCVIKACKIIFGICGVIIALPVYIGRFSACSINTAAGLPVNWIRIDYNLVGNFFAVQKIVCHLGSLKTCFAGVLVDCRNCWETGQGNLGIVETENGNVILNLYTNLFKGCKYAGRSVVVGTEDCIEGQVFPTP